MLKIQIKVNKLTHDFKEKHFPLFYITLYLEINDKYSEYFYEIC